MPLPRSLAHANRVFTNRYIFGPLAGRVYNWVILEHIGRRSGRAHQTVLLAFTHQDVKRRHSWRRFTRAELLEGPAALRLLPALVRVTLALSGIRFVLVLRAS